MDGSIREQLRALSDECGAICRIAGAVGPSPEEVPNFRLLYSSVETFEAGNGLMILGINPGGDNSRADASQHRLPFEDPQYCAYVDGAWGRNPPGRAPLQLAIQQIAQTLFPGRWESMLRHGQCGNVIPFRSTTSGSLDFDLREAGLRVGRQLMLAAAPTLRVVITLAHEAWDAVMAANGYLAKFHGVETVINEKQHRTMREADIAQGHFAGAYVMGLPGVVRDKGRSDVMAPLLETIAQRQQKVVDQLEAR